MAIVRGLNPSVILQNREKLARKLVEKYGFTEADLAGFFYTNPSVMGKFLKERGITPGDVQTVENKQEADSLRIARDKKIRRSESSSSFALALEKNGLWNLPEVKEVPIEALSDFPNAISAKDAMEFLQFGFTFTDAKSYFGLSDLQVKIIKREFDKESIPTGVDLRSSRDSFDAVKDMVHHGYDYRDAVKATGSSASSNERRFFAPESRKDYSYEEYIAYKTAVKKRVLDSIREKSGASPDNSYSSPQKEALKEEAFRRWMGAEKTQLELAEEYGVTRMTIKNWCKEMKVKHRDEISQPTVRRRNLSGKTLKERGLSSYDNPGMMRLFGQGVSAHGKPSAARGAESPFRMASDAKRKEASDISQEIYKRKTEVLFGYGPNRGQSMENGQQKAGYEARLAKTTQLGAEFANVPGARAHADSHEGEMKSFWDETYGPAPLEDAVER